jgi:hypothetical protein
MRAGMLPMGVFLTLMGLINTLGGAANTANKGVDDRGLILNVPN